MRLVLLIMIGPSYCTIEIMNYILLYPNKYGLENDSVESSTTRWYNVLSPKNPLYHSVFRCNTSNTETNAKTKKIMICYELSQFYILRYLFKSFIS